MTGVIQKSVTKKKPDLGHQRAYLRKTLREIDALVGEMAERREALTKTERAIYTKIRDALNYTETLP